MSQFATGNAPGSQNAASSPLNERAKCIQKRGDSDFDQFTREGRSFLDSSGVPKKGVAYFGTSVMALSMEKKSVPVCILVRVSTNRQETDRQLSDLTAYAKEHGYTVAEVCEEVVSGKADESERAGLQRALELSKAGVVKKVLVHEVSRLARRNSVAHAFVEALVACGVSLYWHSQSIETLLPSGKRNPAAGIMFSLLSEMACAERETLIERIRSGMDEAKRKGKHLGRPKGSVLSLPAMLETHRDVVRLLKAGQSVRHTAKISGKAASTVSRVKLALKIAA